MSERQSTWWAPRLHRRNGEELGRGDAVLLGLIACASGGIFIWLLVTEDRPLAQAFLVGTIVASIYGAYSNFAHAVVHGRPEGGA